MSQSKPHESPSRNRHRRIHKAQGRIKKVCFETNETAAKPVPAPQVINPHAAAIDVHSENQVVCVGPDQVRTFGADTVDLQVIADYLSQYGVTTVVLESTGV